MAKPAKRAALYVRVSTDHQSAQVAERRGWTVVEISRDADISGGKGRDKRPGAGCHAQGRQPAQVRRGDGLGH
jgi:hypothetical protein